MGTFGRTKILSHQILEMGPLMSTGHDRPAKPLMLKSIVKASRQKNGAKALCMQSLEWVSLKGEKLIGNVIINAKNYIRTIRGKPLQRTPNTF